MRISPFIETIDHKELEMGIFENIRDRASKARAYSRTVKELRSLPLDTQLDLNIYSGDIEKIAHKAVYGR